MAPKGAPNLSHAFGITCSPVLVRARPIAKSRCNRFVRMIQYQKSAPFPAQAPARSCIRAGVGAGPHRLSQSPDASANLATRLPPGHRSAYVQANSPARCSYRRTQPRAMAISGLIKAGSPNCRMKLRRGIKISQRPERAALSKGTLLRAGDALYELSQCASAPPHPKQPQHAKGNTDRKINQRLHDFLKDRPSKI